MLLATPRVFFLGRTLNRYRNNAKDTRRFSECPTQIHSLFSASRNSCIACEIRDIIEYKNLVDPVIFNILLN